MTTRLLCGVPVELSFDADRSQAAAGFLGGLSATREAAALVVQIEERTGLPRAKGTLHFASPDFEVREEGGLLEIGLRDAGTPVAWVRLPRRGDVTLCLRTNLSAAELSLRDELLPELIVAHLWPLRGLAYLHAAAALASTGARLFTGPSGRGKSTAAALLAAAGEPVVCTDRCAVSAKPAWVAAAPWHGGLASAGERLPLREVFALVRMGPPRCRRLSAAEALAALTTSAFLPRWWPAGLEAGLDALLQIARAVPVFELCSEPDQRLVRRVQERA